MPTSDGDAVPTTHQHQLVATMATVTTCTEFEAVLTNLNSIHAEALAMMAVDKVSTIDILYLPIFRSFSTLSAHYVFFAALCMLIIYYVLQLYR